MDKQNLMFQNRKAFMRDRGAYMKQAYTLVIELVENFETTYKNPHGPEELLQKVKGLVDILEDARYFGFRSIGGNATKPPAFVMPKEFALIDHIAVMYSSAKTISKLLDHECAVRSYERKHPTDDKHLQKYIKNVEEHDYELILENLRAMKKRMDIFNEFYENINRTDYL